MQKETKQKTQSLLTITQLLNEVQHIDDIRITDDGKSVISLSSHDGIGTIHINQDHGYSQKKLCGNYNIRGSVGYGGGGFDLRLEKIAFCEKSGAIYLCDYKHPEQIIQVVPAFLRTCSPKISPNGRWVIFVYEQDEVNGIGIAASNGLSWPRQLAMGADFYMQPQWHPQGEMIAWVEWDHPHMPWDASRIKLGWMGGMQLRLTAETYIDGKESQSASQPAFSADGKWLSYIIRNGEWDDLVLFDLKKKEKKTVICADGFHLRMPDWIQGQRSYQWAPDSNAIYFIKYHCGGASLAKVDIQTRAQKEINAHPAVWISQLDVSADGKSIVCIGSSATSGDEILWIDPSKNRAQSKLIRKTDPTDIPEQITFQNRDGKKGYAWFYPAKVEMKEDLTAPCIFKMHSGPTSLKHAGYSPETEFFRLQGYSVAHLNYRGSVSFGYGYQYALKRKWGIAEIEDTLDLIDALLSRGLIDKGRMAVMGSSAGGFSVLQLLIQQPGLFRAAICSYAVSDLVDDAKNTHKFEKYYHRFLTGLFPQEEPLFIERSPITHIHKIKDPVALFHGEKDPVVSAEQSKKIYAELQKQHVPATLTIFDQEGHGFRKVEHIEQYYQSTLAFLNTYVN